MKCNKGSIAGLCFGIDGEIVQLSKYGEGWHKMFETHNLSKLYKTIENFNTFCYLKYMGMDAEQVFIEKIKNSISN